MANLGGSDGKEPACNAEDLGLISGSGRFPGMATDSSILAEESHGLRRLAGNSPWGPKGPSLWVGQG